MYIDTALLLIAFDCSVEADGFGARVKQKGHATAES